MSIHAPLKRLQNHVLRTAASAAIVLAVGMQCEPAHAGVPVIDYTAIANAWKNYSDQITRWTETAQHYKGVMDHYTQEVAFWQEQMNKLRSINLQLFNIEQDFKPVAEDYGADVMCPGASPSSIIDSVTSALVSAANADADVIGEQQKVCIKMVRTQNRKYNDTVIYLTSLRSNTDSFIDLTTMRLHEIGNSPGNTGGLSAETQRYAANLQLSKDKWQTAMAQYDIQLGLLKQQQAVLSKRAMSGKPSLWGQIVNTAALQGALSINK